MADIKTITLPDNSTYNLRDSNCVIATGTSVGLVRPDGITITVDANGTISSSGGGTQNTWYGTSSTAAATQTKDVVTTTGDFTLATGNMVRVKFTNNQTYNGGIKLNVDSTGAVNATRVGTTATVRYFFLAGEVVDFVYDGTNFIAVNEGIATTTYYGVTKLSSATNSTSTSLAATPSAVKTAYDLANGKQDALVSGTNIKTINGESILGSGDLTVGGDAEALTDQEIEDAVDAVFVVLTYTITMTQAGTCRSITNDGTYGVAITTIIDSASVGDTITFAMHNSLSPIVTDGSGDTITLASVSSYSVSEGPISDIYIVRSFTMPNSDVTISF